MLDLCRAPQNGDTPLHLAADHGHVAVVEMLLAMEVATDEKNKVRGRGWGGFNGHHALFYLCVRSCEQSRHTSLHISELS